MSLDRHPDESASSFFPLEGLRKGPAPRPAVDASLIASLGQRLDQFAEQLSDAERSALSEFLRYADREPPFAALAALPAAAVLKPEEVEIYRRLCEEPAPTVRSLRPAVVLIMKSTRRCNLRCTYCRSWSDEPNQIMPFEVMARAVRDVLRAPEVQSAAFVWHGGESTLRSTAFYRKALWLQERFRRPGQKVVNSIQTNGVTLNDEWLELFKQFRFSVGVSLDGPPEIHDRRRLDVAGRPTAARVREGLAKLQAHGISHGVLVVVDDDILELGAERLLHFLLELGVPGVALLNVVPEGDPGQASASDPYLEFPRYIEFLRDLFRCWWPRYKDRISFREITDLLRKVQGQRGRYCVYDGNCMGGYFTIEPMGEISACDKFQGDRTFQFGNILQMELSNVVASPELVRVHEGTDTAIDRTRDCRWFDVCQGGCPHDRHVRHRVGAQWDESCCGWGPLLADMAEAVGHPR
jgi:uncharacterized protein